MGEGEKVSLKEYIESRLAAQEQARQLALDAVRESMEKDQRHVRTWIAVLGVVISAIGLAVAFLKNK